MVGSWQFHGYGSRLTVIGDYAHTGAILDLRDLPDLEPVGWDWSLAGWNVEVEGARAYVHGEDGSLSIYDVSDPLAPSLLIHYASDQCRPTG
jgi:hypothetical protein